MNPSNASILSIVSIRFKADHVDPALYPHASAYTHHKSINQAKAKSKELGGLGKVRAARDAKQFRSLLLEWKQADHAERLRHASTQYEAAAKAHNEAVEAAASNEDPTKQAQLEVEQDLAAKVVDEAVELYNKIKAEKVHV